MDSSINIIFIVIFMVIFLHILFEYSRFKIIVVILFVVGLVTAITGSSYGIDYLKVIGEISYTIVLFLGIYGYQNRIKSNIPIVLFISIFLLEQLIGYGLNIDILKVYLLSEDRRNYSVLGASIPILVLIVTGYLYKKKEEKRLNNNNGDELYMQPNYIEFGLSIHMGEKLRNEVERQLSIDLKHYGVKENELRFDWSDSCIEGHHASIMDGHLENFSGIKVFNCDNEFLADGWMEFIYEKDIDLFIVFWEFIDVYENGKVIMKKNLPGIPDYILDRLPEYLRSKYSSGNTY